MLRSIAAQYNMLASRRASHAALGPAVVSLERRLAGALVVAAKRGAEPARRLMRRAMAKARMEWMAVIGVAAALCGRFARMSGDARELGRKSLAALARRPVLSRWSTRPAALTRFIAARYRTLRSRRDGASYSDLGRASVSRTAAVLRTRLPLTKRHAPGHASRLCRNALSWMRRRRGAIAERARRIFVERRLAGAFAAATRPRFQSAWRFTQRAMVKARMEWIAGITAAVGVALCGMFFWMSWHAREIVIADTYASSSNLALSVEQFIARTMETVDLSLRVATAEIAADASKAPKDIHRLLASRVRHSPQITSILLIDPNGRVRLSSEALPGLPINVAKKKYFTRAGGDAIRVTMEQPVTPRSDGTRVIFASRRITRSDGRFAGVIAATINGDYIQRFLSTLHVGAQGSIALHTIDGTMLIRQPAVGADVGRNFGSAPLFRDWLPWASSGVFPTNFGADGLWRIVGYQRVERLPLVAEVALSRDEALANWQRTTLWQAGVGGLILVLSGLTACALHQQLRARRDAHRELSETVRELENARRTAEESSRVKSQFMANMSHELRTPLNAIIGFSEVIRDAHVGPVDTRYQGYAQDIHSSGQHLLGLINDVLDLSKIEAGRLTLHEEPVDLAKLAGDCQRLLAERFRTAQLALVIELPPHVPCVRADEMRLKQILLNLLGNAAKFTPAGGRVVLAVAATPEGAVRLSVSDTGVGMRREEIPLALQPFRQVDSSLNRRYDGAGLGLPLARTLAELHGGRLAIESAPGEGTKVSITLPARRVLREGEAPGPRLSSPDRPAIRRGTLRSDRHTSPQALPVS